MTAPNGIDTSAVGRIVTLAMNQHCWMNSLVWNGRRGRARRTSRTSAKSDPLWRRAPMAGLLTTDCRRLAGLGVAHAGDAGVVRLERPGRRGDAVGAAPLPGRALAAARRCRRWCRAGAGSAAAAAAPGRRASAASSSASFSSDMPIGPMRLGVEELAHDRLLELQQHLARPEHGQVPVVEQADVVGHGAGGVDVVRDDEEGRVDLGVEVDDQLVEVGRAHRVEAGVRLVEQEDLGVEHERPGQAGALAHPAGDLAGQLGLGAGAGRPGPSSP